MASLLWESIKDWLNEPVISIGGAETPRSLKKARALTNKILISVQQLRTRCSECWRVRLVSSGVNLGMQLGNLGHRDKRLGSRIARTTAKNARWMAIFVAQEGARTCERLLRRNPDARILLLYRVFVTCVDECKSCKVDTTQLIDMCPVVALIQNVKVDGE